MAHLRVRGYVEGKDYSRLGITKYDNIIPLHFEEAYSSKVISELHKVFEKQKDNKDKGNDAYIPLDVDIDIHYRQRSTDQNKWLWAAHALEARLINTKDQIWRDEKGITWYKPGAVTPEEIHESYNERYAPRAKLIVDSNNVPFFRKMLTESIGKIVNETPVDSGHVEFTIWKTSSYLTVAEFCALADHAAENMLAYGIDISNGLDWNTLMADLEGIKSRAVTKDESETGNDSTVTDEPIVLKLRKDSVTIVKDLFNGEEV